MHNVLKFSTEILAVTLAQSGLSLKCQDRKRKCWAGFFSLALDLPIILLSVTPFLLPVMVFSKNLRGGMSNSESSTQPPQGGQTAEVITLGWPCGCWSPGQSCQTPTSNTETHFWNCKMRYYMPHCYHNAIRKGFFSQIKEQQRADKKGHMQLHKCSQTVQFLGSQNIATESFSWEKSSERQWWDAFITYTHILM